MRALPRPTNSTHSSSSKAILTLAEGANKLADDVGLARYVCRFRGGLECFDGIRTGAYASDYKDERIDKLTLYSWQVICFYYGCELVSYGAFTLPPTLMRGADADKWGR